MPPSRKRPQTLLGGKTKRARLARDRSPTPSSSESSTTRSGRSRSASPKQHRQQRAESPSSPQFASSASSSASAASSAALLLSPITLLPQLSVHSVPLPAITLAVPGKRSRVPVPEWKSNVSFAAAQTFESALPIFRASDVQVRPVAEDKTNDELAQLTFAEWLDYFLRLSTTNRKGLYSDQQYVDLLHACKGSQSVADQMAERTKTDRN